MVVVLSTAGTGLEGKGAAAGRGRGLAGAGPGRGRDREPEPRGAERARTWTPGAPTYPPGLRISPPESSRPPRLSQAAWADRGGGAGRRSKMSFQGKKNIPRMTVSPTPGPRSALRLPPGAGPSLRVPAWSLLAPRRVPCPPGPVPTRAPVPALALLAWLLPAPPGSPASAAPDPLTEPDAQVQALPASPGPPLRPGGLGTGEGLLPRAQKSLPPRGGRAGGPGSGLGALPRGRRADTALCWYPWPGLEAGDAVPRAAPAPWTAPPPRPELFVRNNATQLRPLGLEPWRPEPLHGAGVRRPRGSRALSSRR